MANAKNKPAGTAGGVSSTRRGSGRTTAAIWQLSESYMETTPSSLLLIDVALAFLIGSAFLQLIYCLLGSSFPFNAFLGAFSIHVGQFVLLASLRSQVNPINSNQFDFVSPERAFADFVFGSLILHFFGFNFLG
ncbi:hypothetical protein VP01_83g11 [Puccinia sorghi]|uniref:Dolichyl-diphosphooligosaccharide--protein glycosyltransferase subunit OST2 n=1 Tax=Puccinia sorghi TaxID=27349 RepID=A0A0L6U9F3_9BASI|nr:hypothetical protein VP01_83g11 [Puccinia sorghi]